MSILHELGFLAEQEVAAALGVTANELAKWRGKNTGPPYSRSGNVTLYPIDGLREWIKAGVVVPGQPAG